MAPLWAAETLELTAAPLDDWAVTGVRRLVFSWLKDSALQYLSACPSACDCPSAYWSPSASGCPSASDCPLTSTALRLRCASASQCPSASDERRPVFGFGMLARDSAWSWVRQSVALSSSESAAVERQARPVQYATAALRLLRFERPRSAAAARPGLDWRGAEPAWIRAG